MHTFAKYANTAAITYGIRIKAGCLPNNNSDETKMLTETHGSCD